MFMQRKRYLIIIVAVLALAAAACVCTSSLPIGGSGGGTTGGGSTGGGGGTGYDGGDGLETNYQGSIAVGGSASGNIDSLFVADNWTFQGSSGQSVTIFAEGVGETDPRIKLIDPNGSVRAEDDDGGGGYNSLIETSLPMDGQYTIRVDVFTAGNYNLTLE